MKSLQYGWEGRNSAQIFAAGHVANTVWLQQGLHGNHKGAQGLGPHFCHPSEPRPPLTPMSPGAPVPHAHQSLTTHGCRQSPVARPAPTHLRHKQEEPTRERQNRPLWTLPSCITPSQRQKTQSQQLCPSASPRVTGTHSLGKGCFPAATSAQHRSLPLFSHEPRDNSPSTARARVQPQRGNDARWEPAAANPRKGELQSTGMVQEPLRGARSSNSGVGEQGLG